VSNGEVVGQENTLLGQGLEVLVRSGGGEVLVASVRETIPREQWIKRLTVFSIQISTKRSKARPLTLETGE
jgi:hypothetical protein